MLAHGQLQDLENLRGIAVVVEQLPNRRKKDTALELYFCILWKKLHRSQDPSQAMERPHLRATRKRAGTPSQGPDLV